MELGRLDGGLSGGAVAPSKLPWRLQVARTMALSVGGVPQEYGAAAVVYNDGSHWWADLMASGHFKRESIGPNGERLPKGSRPPKGMASYRYDGLEASGRLRFAGSQGLTLTSDERHVSFVLYRRHAAPSDAPPCCQPTASLAPLASEAPAPFVAPGAVPTAPAPQPAPSPFSMPALYRSVAPDPTKVATGDDETQLERDAWPDAWDDDGDFYGTMPWAASSSSPPKAEHRSWSNGAKRQKLGGSGKRVRSVSSTSPGR